MVRSILYLLALLVAPISAQFGKTRGLRLCRPEHAKERKNFNDLSLDEKTKLFRAIEKLNEPGRKRGWSYYAKMHVKHFKVCHFTELFLIWHRLFLFNLEKDLQSIDKDVTLPYWDWTRHSQKPDEDPVLSGENLGGGGKRETSERRTTRCLKDGRFKNFMVQDISNKGQVSGPKCLERNPDLFRSAFLAPELMEKGPLSKKTMMEFGEELERGGHAIVHNAIGLGFMEKASPRDPLFFLHHAFIDKLWYDWQKRNFGQGFSPEIVNSQSLLPPWNVNPMHLMDPMSHMCYYYKENTFSWDPTFRPYTRRTATNKQPTADQTIGLDSKTIDKVEKNFTLPPSVIHKAALNPQLQESLLQKGSVAPSMEDKDDLCNIRIPKPMPKKYMDMMEMPLKEREAAAENHRKLVSWVTYFNTKPGFVSLSAPVHTNASVSSAECTDPNFNLAKDIAKLNPKARPITNLTDTESI